MNKNACKPEVSLKEVLLGLMMILLTIPAITQVRIHAHNDYEKANPLTNALQAKVFSIEADVFVLDNTLAVAHTRNQIDPFRTLESLYVNPIILLFKQNRGYISPDTSYKVSLVIDIKEKPEVVLPYLVNMVEKNRQYFDPGHSPGAVRIIISGDRGSQDNWTNYPSYINFDGRPYENYTPVMLEKVAVISDNYRNYVAGDTLKAAEKLRAMIKLVHKQGKLLRLWGASDDAETWSFLHGEGVDIINTDKVNECRRYFEHVK